MRGGIIPEAKNPLNRALIAIYRPVFRAVLKAKTLTIALAAVILAVPVWPLTQGATSIRTENAKLATSIFVDIRDRDLGGYVADAKKAVTENVKLPSGTYLVWSGQFEFLECATARLKLVVPVSLKIIFLLLYLNFRRLTETLIVMLSLPFALVGGFWLMSRTRLWPVKKLRTQSRMHKPLHRDVPGGTDRQGAV